MSSDHEKLAGTMVASIGGDRQLERAAAMAHMLGTPEMQLFTLRVSQICMAFGGGVAAAVIALAYAIARALS